VTQTIKEASDKVWQAVTQDAYDAGDIGQLISLALDLQERYNSLLVENDELRVHNQYLVNAVEISGRRIEQLEPFSHLVQYAEEVEPSVK